MDVAKAEDSKLGDKSNAPQGSRSSQFECGSSVRVSGLEGEEAAKLNGQVAKVIRLAAEKDRYDVQSYTNNEIKSVPAVNLQLLTVIEEVNIWRDMLSGSEVTAIEARPALLQLGKLQITVDVLAKTRIGKVVNDTFKRLPGNDEVANMAKQLVTKWKTMFNQSKAGKEKQSNASPASDPGPTTAAKSGTSSGLDSKAGASTKTASPQKRPRSLEVAQASPSTSEQDAHSPAKCGKSKGLDSQVSTSVKEGSPRKRPRPMETAQAPASATEQDACPPELIHMDPQVRNFLKGKPHICEFLTKHPSAMQNINADTVQYLYTNLQKAWDTEVLKGEDATSGSQLTVSNLPDEATEQEVANLFSDAGMGPVQVNLPRESRNLKSCGVAWVGVSSPELAKTAVERLNGSEILQQKVVVEWLEDADSARKPEADEEPPRISWKANHELWREVVFLKDESIEEFKTRMDRGMPDQMPKMPANANEGFQAAAGAERAQEAKLVRDALSQAS
eukprot:TRINITY_DN33571_c0_g1_i1.p1 TRINITY_DN33571_c0_g1~~TRINITY_DN33571_c0_g1_i1.p1  ORF type:complete len:504 (-),score=115.95 TRINITY_DN33571_c0_g1_i1:19-1530(-)